MNILLWVLQVLLALHTVMGAVWKFSNSEQAVPSLNAIPHGAWLSLSVVELMCSVALVAPALSKALGMFAPAAALCIMAEMLLFCAIHLSSGDSNKGQMIYWLTVAVFCLVIAIGRLWLSPL